MRVSALALLPSFCREAGVEPGNWAPRLTSESAETARVVLRTICRPGSVLRTSLPRSIPSAACSASRSTRLPGRLYPAAGVAGRVRPGHPRPELPIAVHDQGQQRGAQASSGVVTLAGFPRPPLTLSLVRRHPAHDRAQQAPPGQRPLAALGQDGAALAHLQRGLLPGPNGREVVIPGPVGRRQQVPACGPLSGRTVGVAGSGWGGRTEVTGRRGGAGERRLRGWVAWGHRVTG